MNQTARVGSGRRTMVNGVVLLAGLLACAAPAAAQTTVVLDGPRQHVWDTMIQNGRHAATNFDGGPLLTRASADPDWERRSILTIDTANTIPRNSTIVSATLTLTVRSGLGSAGSTRRVAAYRVTQSFQVKEATWQRRDAKTSWSTPGGALAERYGPVSVPATAGAKVHVDLTALVQQAVNGQLETYWTRFALVDIDGDAKESYREYFSSEASDPSVRPRLTVVYGSSSSRSTSSTTGAHTVVLDGPRQHVWDTMIQNGRHASSNFDGRLLLTRASADPDWERRSLLTIDTANTVPANSTIVSATLTLTVRSGLGTAGSTRRVGAFRVTQSFQVKEATWQRRDAKTTWTTAGGTLAERSGLVSVPATPGAKVNIDLTAHVQQAVSGKLETRWTRFALVDIDGAAKESYREYFSSEASDPSVRPRLTVVYNGDPPPRTSTSPSEPPPSTSPTSPSSQTTVRVLQWNIAQGWATNGTSNLDWVVDWIVKMKPDVISFNEAMHHSSSSHIRLIADKLKARTGRTWAYHWVQKWGASTGEGVAVMTHLPIESTGSHLLSYNRSVSMVRVTVNGRTLNVFSTHLEHKRENTSWRLTQIRELKAWMANFAQQRIVAGDFNAWPGTTEINEMVKDFHDGWAVAKSQGRAVAYPDNPDGNTRNTRIDFVFHSKGATSLAVKSAQVYDTRNSSGHRPSDHNPLVVTYEVR